MKNIFVMTVVFILLFPNLYGNITGTSIKNDNDKNILSSPRAGIGPANSPWPVFRHDLGHTGRSQVDTSKNNGLEKWEFDTGSSIFSSPAIDPDGTIYFGSEYSKLYALYTNGLNKW